MNEPANQRMNESTESLSPAVKLAMDLIRRESISPVDAGCQSMLADRLWNQQKLGLDGPAGADPNWQYKSHEGERTPRGHGLAGGRAADAAGWDWSDQR